VYSLFLNNQGNLWIGTRAGLVLLKDGNWQIFNMGNSGLPDLWIRALLEDDLGNIWIGTDKGLVCYDGSNWKVHLSGTKIKSLAKDKKGGIWAGTNSTGLRNYNGTKWYDTPGNLPDGHVYSIAIDDQDNKWIGTEGGLTKFDGTNLTTFNTSNSDLPDNIVGTIRIDDNGKKWIGTGGGVAVFDDTNWKVYNKSNSALANDGIKDILIDSDNNKWIATYNSGLTIFREGGVSDEIMPIIQNTPVSKIDIPKYLKSEISIKPNPVNSVVEVNYALNLDGNVSFRVTDLTGRPVMSVSIGYQTSGVHYYQLNLEDHTDGLYFITVYSNGEAATTKLIVIH
jgi:hypothetical protein